MSWTWSTFDIDVKAQYPCQEDFALYLMELERCVVLRVVTIGWNNHGRPLPTTICWYTSPKLRYRFMLRIIVPWFPRSPRGNNLSSVWCHDIIAIFDTLFEVSMLRANKDYCPTQAKGLRFSLRVYQERSQVFVSQSLWNTRLIKTYSIIILLRILFVYWIISWLR